MKTLFHRWELAQIKLESFNGSIVDCENHPGDTNFDNQQKQQTTNEIKREEEKKDECLAKSKWKMRLHKSLFKCAHLSCL